MSYMSKLLCKGVQKLLGECFFQAALLPNQNVLPCVRYAGGKLCVSTNHVRHRKNVRLFFVQVLLGTVPQRWGVQSRYIS